jgi:hypothetical protein
MRNKILAFLLTFVPALAWADAGVEANKDFIGYSYTDSVGLNTYRAVGQYKDIFPVRSGDKLFYIDSYGHNGTRFATSPSASMAVLATEDWSSTANGSEIRFYVTPEGSTASQEIMRISDDFVLFNGSVTFGGGTSLIVSTQAALKFEVNASTPLTLNTSSVTVTGSLHQTGLLVEVSSTVTINANGDGTATAYTLTPARSLVYFACTDSDGCNVTMSETGAIDGTVVMIVNRAANVVNFADSAGVSEIGGAFAAGIHDAITLIYESNTWTELSRSNN